jgi:hypothetical protein
MIDTITTIQEVTLQAKELGLYEYLFVKRNLSRDEALNLLEMWAKEFEKSHESFVWDGSVSYYDEIDKFVENRLCELRCEDYFHGEVTIGSVIRFVGGLFKVVRANANGLVVEPIGPKGNTWGYFTEISYSNKDKISVVPNYPDVMDTTEGHHPLLVGYINREWVKRRDEFAPILRTLYARDAEKIYKNDAFKWDDTLEASKDYMEEYWDLHARNYLMNVADNSDLQTILHYLRVLA